MARPDKLLIFDGLINLILGIVLLIFPSDLITFLGVPAADSTFYPNILGGVLVGIAIALFLEGRNVTGTPGGLGLLGAVVINLCGGAVIGAWLLWGDLDLPLRGSVFLWSLVIVLAGISSIELAARFSRNEKSM